MVDQHPARTAEHATGDFDARCAAFLTKDRHHFVADNLDMGWEYAHWLA
jgi:hypothetical protein